jgi:pimeloyl-ACP methyl ester carboxylesterase
MSGAAMVPVTALILILLISPGCGWSGARESAELAAVAREAIAVKGAPGRTISYLRAGDARGRRVLLIHGTPGSGSQWESFLVHPPPESEIFAPDRLGFGRSLTSVDDGCDSHRAVTGFAEQAAALAPLLIDHDGRGTIVVGHSLGGPIAAWLAAEHPDCVAGLVILAGSLDPDLEEWRWYNEVASWWVVQWALPDEIVRANREVRDAAEQARALRPLLARIRCPVIIIHGTADDLVPLGNAEYARREMAGAANVETLIIDGEGHFLPWVREAEIREAIDALIRP